MTPPERPRLGRHVAARRHVADGAATVLLVDQQTGRTVRVGEREWAVAASMDGTRGVEGLVVAAGRRGAATTAARVADFVRELAAIGFVLEGADVPAPAPGEAAPASADRPIDALPGFRLSCDGLGSCCRLYPTIVFLPRDVVRARAALPDVLDGGDDEAAAFTPGAGAVDAVSAPALVDGRCAYLQRDGRCGVHAALGGDAKPFGCRTYPLAFVDDGASIRVAPKPECACVPRSASSTGGEPLVAESVRTRADLPAELVVRRVPASIVLARGGGPAGPHDARRASRDEVASWSRAVAAPSTPDAAAAFAALADAVVHGLDGPRHASLVAAPPPLDPARFRARIAALGDAAARKAAERWRSPRDLAQQAFVALETACALAATAPETFALGPRDERERRAEALHLQALVFGHHLVVAEPAVPLAEALEERAALVVAARALGLVAELAELPDPAFAWPLALLEALVRAHSL